MTSRTRSDELRTVPVWLVVGVWAMILSAWLVQASFGTSVNRTNEWKVVALDWAPWLLVAPGIIWLCTRWPIDQRSWRWGVPLHVVLSLLISATLGTLAWRSMSAFGPPGLREWGEPPPPMHRPPPPEEAGPGPDRWGPPEFRDEDARFHRPPPPGQRGLPLMFVLTRGRASVFFYWALLAVSHTVTYHRRSVQREREALAAEARLAEARLTALQAQLQPHFLFNTLNAISSMVYEHPRSADAMVCALSDMLRRVLAASSRREVSLAEELLLARSYVSIQQVRFSESLQVTWDVPEAITQAAVPTLLLQPLIENAVVHGVEENEGATQIIIRAEKKADRLLLTIEDTGTSSAREHHGVAATGFKGTGTGLTNTQARLQALYGDDQRFAFTTKPSSGAIVSIEIPFRVTGEVR